MKKTKKIHNNILALDTKIVDGAIPISNLELKGIEMPGKDWGKFGIDLLEVYPPDLYMTQSDLSIYNSDPARSKMFAMYDLKDKEVSLEKVTYKQKPFSGWAKLVDDNQKVRRFIQYKDGKKDGLEIFLRNSGLKKCEKNYKDGEWDGVYVWYNEDGTEKSHLNEGQLEQLSYSLKGVGITGLVIGYALISYCAIYEGHPIFAIIGCFVLLASYVCYYWD